MRKRLKASWRRALRLKMLRNAHHSATKLYGAGVASVSAYGAQVFGAGPPEVAIAQSNFLLACCPGSSGRSRTKGLLWLGDPTATLAVSPIVHWAKEVWEAASGRAGNLGMAALSRAWHTIELLKPSSWAKVRGPVGATSLSMERLGWRPTGPFAFVDHTGANRDFLSCSPCYIGTLGKQARHSISENQLQVKLGLLYQPALSPPCRRAIRCMRDDLAFKRGTLLSYLVEAIWPAKLLCDAGYDYPATCGLCGEEDDTMEHRLRFCPCTEDLRDSMLSQSDRYMVFESEFAPYLSRGLLPQLPPASMPLSMGGHFWSTSHDIHMEDAFAEGVVYSDGSCYKGTLKYQDRAGWAIVTTTAEGQPLASLSGPCWAGFNQTSPSAECAAL